jgi:hypothetical protein
VDGLEGDEGDEKEDEAFHPVEIPPGKHFGIPFGGLVQPRFGVSPAPADGCPDTIDGIWHKYLPFIFLILPKRCQKRFF